MGSSFIHLIRTDSNEFFLMTEQYSIVYMHHSFLIHLSADGLNWVFLNEASLVAQAVKNLSAMNETEFDPWVRKIPYRRKWPPTPVFLPGEFHGQRNLAGVHGVTKSQTQLSN